MKNIFLGYPGGFGILNSFIDNIVTENNKKTSFSNLSRLTPLLAKSVSKFNPKYKHLNMFWTSPKSGGRLKGLGNLVLSNNF